ncbi:MAG: helix-turn-helix transcriptional regulator [Rhodanobacteraceae bacterium]
MTEALIERRIRIEEVMRQTGLSRAGVYRHEKTDPNFPKHIKEGATSLWVESEVQRWIRESIRAARDAA